jgi:hypothetical protein
MLEITQPRSVSRTFFASFDSKDEIGLVIEFKGGKPENLEFLVI